MLETQRKTSANPFVYAQAKVVLDKGHRKRTGIDILCIVSIVPAKKIICTAQNRVRRIIQPDNHADLLTMRRPIK